MYVAINIYAPDNMYDEIKEQVEILNKLAADGVLVADGGVLDIVKEFAPDIPIHISTQANTLSAHTALFWYKNGAKRIVLSREMNKNDIKYLIENIPQGLETEMFIHGAICWAYSGRCYLSDFMASRNANLGDCAQSCRWAYNMYVEEKNNPGNIMPVEEDSNGTYVMSSKDLCLIKDIPEIMDLGELNKVKTRDLTTFFFDDKNNKDFQEFSGKQYNPDYEFGGEVQEYNDDKSIIKIGNKLTVGDKMEILVPNKIEPQEFWIDKLWDSETDEEIDHVNPGRFGQTVKMKLPIKCENGWVIRRKK